MRSLDLTVEPRRPGLDICVADTEILDMPVELRLELVTAIGADRVDPEGELSDDVAHEVYCVLLSMPAIDLERPYARRVIDGRVLEPADCLALGIDERKELDVDLDVVAGHLFLVAVEASDAPGALITGKDIHPIALKNIVHASGSDLYPVITL